MKSSLSLFLVLVAALFNNGVVGFAYSRPAFVKTSSSLQMTILSYNGKKKDFKAGTPLSKAVQQLGIKPTYSCKK
jgi:hypothetical protein